MSYYNGALVISETLNLREHYSIDSSINTELIDYFISSESDPYLSVEVEDSWFSNRELDYTELMQIKTKPQIIRIEEMRQLAASKLLITNYSDAGKLIERFIQKVNIVITDSGALIQISSKKASKENAVAQICERLDCSLDEIMVFGDDYNDLGLFHVCGYPIAMGNAIEELKDIAYEVTETNDHDGVAVMLERVCR